MTTTCACDATYRDDAAGRLHHKQVHGHAPAPRREQVTGQWAAAVAKASERRSSWRG